MNENNAGEFLIKFRWWQVGGGDEDVRYTDEFGSRHDGEQEEWLGDR